jgi:hypothetical protein
VSFPSTTKNLFFYFYFFGCGMGGHTMLVDSLLVLPIGLVLWTIGLTFSFLVIRF